MVVRVQGTLDVKNTCLMGGQMVVMVEEVDTLFYVEILNTGLFCT
jgi:hypothetical protein